MIRLLEYFIRSILKSMRAFIRFYCLAAINFWSLPKAFDFSDTTLAIRVVKYNTANIAVLSVLMYCLDRAFDHWLASQVTRMTYPFFLIFSYVHLMTISICLYVANSFFPQSKKQLSLQECVTFELVFGLLCSPLVAILFLAFPSPLWGITYVPSLVFVILMVIFYVAFVVVKIRNFMILLELKLNQLFGFLFVFALVCIAIWFLFQQLMVFYFDIPAPVRNFIENFVYTQDT